MENRVSLIACLLILFGGLGLFLQDKPLFADLVKKEIFDLGYDIGRPCSQGLEMNDLLSADSRIINSIRRHLGGAVNSAGGLGIPTGSIERLLKEARMLTREQYLGDTARVPRGRSRMVMDELQQECRDRYGEPAALIFTQGVWMGGAECTAAFGLGFEMRTRPGTYALIRRNVSWLRGNAGLINVSRQPIDRLDEDMNKPGGVTFGEALDRLEKLRQKWQQELLDQPSFAADLTGPRPPARGRISFIANAPFEKLKTQKSYLYTINEDGSDRKEVLGVDENLSEGAWSPDGTRLIFNRYLNNNRELLVVNADGSGLRNLTNHPGYDCRGVWSPDGTKIAFESNRGHSSGQLWIMDADGSNPKRRGGPPSSDTVGGWSPDGKKIVFSSSLSPEGTNIFTVDAGGAGLKQLTKLNGICRGPVYSPDGEKIAFDVMSKDYNSGEIYTMNADGSNLRKLTSLGLISGFPRWSADGKALFFTVYQGAKKSVYSVGPDGSNPKKVLDEGINPQGFDFSPDGEKIVFTSEKDGSPGLYVVNRDGSGLKKIAQPVSSDCPPHWSR